MLQDFMLNCKVYKNKIPKLVFYNDILFTFVNPNRIENRKNQEDMKIENEEMKDRIAHIIRAKNLTAAEFAMRLGIQPSNVSHLLAGRNNPSLEFVRKLKETFPEYNLDWIVLGTGPMTVSEPFIEKKPVINEPVATLVPEDNAPESLDGILFAPENAPAIEPLPAEPRSESSLKHIIMVYADNSFEVLSPR